ncbi:MAG: outer membrane beta-barrel protein [Myxococcota bacterium]|mgnify:CR=1 FL=1|jgi:hypothetical protein|nr:outer membrane beta-barrel protein [Myxococcota bacterium]MEC9442552.1 outer membrane beta-barrel protein [Myxococcota bacterium]
MKPHKFALAASIALLTLTVSQSAMALDGYQDRRGLFAGVGVGGGVGLVDVEGNESTGIDSGRKLGLHLNGMIGGGASDRLVIGGEGNWWARTAYIGDNALSHHHMSFNAVANFFILDGLFVEGGGGLAYAIFDTQGPSVDPIHYQELGLAVKGGAGFEMFVNSQVALGLKVGYTRHFYTNADFDTVAGGVTVRWY